MEIWTTDKVRISAALHSKLQESREEIMPAETRDLDEHNRMLIMLHE